MNEDGLEAVMEENGSFSIVHLHSSQAIAADCHGDSTILKEGDLNNSFENDSQLLAHSPQSTSINPILNCISEVNKMRG